MPKRLSATEKKEIIQLYNSGISPTKIAERFNIYPNSVNRIIRNNNGKSNQLIRLTNEQEKIIIERYIAGESSEIIAKELNIDGTTACRVLKRNHIEIRPATKNKRKYKINENYFEIIDTPEKAYFLGVLYSDGNVSKDKNDIKIALKYVDEDIIKKLAIIIYGFENIHYENGTCLTAVLRITCQKMKDDLINLGCIPNKTFSIRYPLIDKKLNSHFIRGYFDGDGCISINKEKNKFVFDITSNTIFINDLANIIKNDINIECGIYVDRRNENTACLQFSSRENIKKIYDYLYQDADIFMERKYNKFQQALQIIEYKKQKNNINDTIDYWFNYFRQRDFPYPTYSNDVLRKDFDNLKNLDVNKLVENKILVSYNTSGLKLFKYFNKHFYSIRSNNKSSMLDAFNDDNILVEVIKNRLERGYKLSDNMLRQGLRNGYFAFHASIFYPFVAKYLYEKYCDYGDVVYDYSMGFGQRMLGAVSSNKNLKYIGCDPYQKNIDAGNDMMKFLVDNNCIAKNNTTLICSGSENYIGEKVSLTFSSPPYYNKEIYCDENSQAYKTFYNDFINNWWDKTCSNINAMLKDEGIFVLNMAKKINNNNILDDMLNVCFRYGFVEIDRYFIKLSRNEKYREKKLEPIIIMKKTKIV